MVNVKLDTVRGFRNSMELIEPARQHISDLQLSTNTRLALRSLGSQRNAVPPQTMDSGQQEQQVVIPGYILFIIFTILATNTILDSEPRTNLKAWDNASPFVCAYQCIHRIVEIGSSLLQRRPLSFSLGNNDNPLLRCLNLLACLTFTTLILLVRNAAWYKFLAGIYITNWVLSRSEAAPEAASEAAIDLDAKSPSPSRQKDDQSTRIRQQADTLFIIIIHSTYCFATFTSFNETLLWTAIGTIIALILGPRLREPPSDMTTSFMMFIIHLCHWYFLTFGIFMGHGPVSSYVPQDAGTDEAVQRKARIQECSVAFFDLALAAFLCSSRDWRRERNWGDVGLAVLVLGTGVVHFGWLHETYAIIGTAAPTTIGRPSL